MCLSCAALSLPLREQAEVCKLEPIGGEPIRLNPSFRNSAGFGAGFELFNRGKRSIQLDLKNPKAVEIVERLVRWADVSTHQRRRRCNASPVGETGNPSRRS